MKINWLMQYMYEQSSMNAACRVVTTALLIQSKKLHSCHRAQPRQAYPALQQQHNHTTAVWQLAALLLDLV